VSALYKPLLSKKLNQRGENGATDGSGSAEEDLTDQETLQSRCFDHDSHSHASRNHPPSLTHYPTDLYPMTSDFFFQFKKMGISVRHSS